MGATSVVPRGGRVSLGLAGYQIVGCERAYTLPTYLKNENPDALMGAGGRGDFGMARRACVENPGISYSVSISDTRF